MQIGEEYRVFSDSVPCKTPNVRPRIHGKVTYIHPQGRFATLEFQGIHGKFRECYYPEQLTEQNRVGRRNRRCR